MPNKNDRSNAAPSNPAKTSEAGTTGPRQAAGQKPIPGRDVGEKANGGRGPDEKTGHGKTPELGARDGGRELQDGPPHHDEPGRGSALQGEHQDARGGPMGANQGGAPRGGSRVEPSHAQERAKQDRGDSHKQGKK